MNLTRWSALMQYLNLPPSVETCNALLRAHSGSSRHYHNTDHVTHCLNLVAQFRSQIPDADFVALALWFHDAIYDAQSKTNEEDSADWAVQFLQESGATAENSKTVHQLIMATKHIDSELSSTQAWMVDIDLSILGSDDPTFDLYERNIRKEYAWVPMAEFNQRRAALLEGFLARQWIFSTHPFRDQYETAARENLRRSITQLRSKSDNY